MTRETVENLPFVLKQPAPSVWIADMGDSAVILRIAAWIAQHDTGILLARSEAIRLCLAAFDKAGIYMPETTLRVLTGPGGGDQAGPTSQSAARVAPTVEVEAQAAPATAEAALEKIVDSERRELRDQDLLNRGALEE